MDKQQTTETKSFPLRVVLSVTTERLLTEPRDGGNGIGDLYEILNWMTEDNLFTHQLPSANDACKPLILKTFPELHSVNACLHKLDDWIRRDRTNGIEGVKMWLTEIKMLFPNLKDSYDIPRLSAGSFERQDPVEELSDKVNGVIVVTV